MSAAVNGSAPGLIACADRAEVLIAEIQETAAILEQSSEIAVRLGAESLDTADVAEQRRQPQQRLSDWRAGR